MSLPKPKRGESKASFMKRFMLDAKVIERYPEKEERLEVADYNWNDGEYFDED